MSANVATVYRPSYLELMLTAAAVWLMLLVTFHLPGRSGPEQVGSIDFLALAKLAIRVGVIATFLVAWRFSPDYLVKRAVLSAYLPLIGFVGWAFLSVLWSPLKTVSIGQALGLAALVTISAWIALACRSVSQRHFVMRQLLIALLVFSASLLAIHLARPDLSGLDRELQLEGANGLCHPTVAASTASVGFVLTLLAIRTLPNFSFGYFVLPALCIHAAVIYFAQNRTALAMTGFVALLSVVWFYPRKTHAKLLVLISALIITWLVADPGFLLLEDRLEAGAELLSRGQTEEQLMGVSGRMEIWGAVLEQFQLSPWLGHGYFVTSADGRLDVWNRPANHTAHNLVLQVLVSTGILGAMLLLFALLRLLSVVLQLRDGDEVSRGVFHLTALVGLWYLGWSVNCISFLGPITPESVAFFVVLGLAVGQAFELQSIPPGLRGTER